MTKTTSGTPPVQSRKGPLDIAAMIGYSQAAAGFLAARMLP
jgi:hypothetical protein